MSINCAFEVRGFSLSGIERRPAGMPRAIVLALHGGGYSAGYWDHPNHSLLGRAAARGMLGLALDRPGYGSARTSAMPLAGQAEVILDFVEHVRAREATVPLFLAGHSMGALLALKIAADARAAAVAAIDASGVPLRFPEPMRAALAARTPASGQTHFPAPDAGHVRAVFYGPDGSFDPAMLDYDAASARPMPVAELPDAARAPDWLPAVMARITLPVRLSMAAEEKSSIVDAEVAALARSGLARSRAAEVRTEPGTGHNISLHHVGGRFHDTMLDWFEAVSPHATA